MTCTRTLSQLSPPRRFCLSRHTAMPAASSRSDSRRVLARITEERPRGIGGRLGLGRRLVGALGLVHLPEPLGEVTPGELLELDGPIAEEADRLGVLGVGEERGILEGD